MTTVHYFAYGSNLHPLRLQQRIPSAQLVGTTTLAGYELAFNKRGQDESGKGHIQPAAGQSQVHGAVYQMAAEHITDLDRFEGAGYQQKPFELTVDGQPYSCFAYVGEATHLDDSLQPFHWYKSLIVLGAQFHDFPSHYIQSLQQTLSTNDPDPHRCLQHEQLITRMQDYTSD